MNRDIWSTGYRANNYFRCEEVFEAWIAGSFQECVDVAVLPRERLQRAGDEQATW